MNLPLSGNERDKNHTEKKSWTDQCSIIFETFRNIKNDIVVKKKEKKREKRINIRYQIFISIKKNCID